MIDLNKIKKIHFTGIKGVGMTALALIAKDMGISVSGSDVAEIFVTDSVLKQAKIFWQKHFSEKNLKNIDLLVFSAGHNGIDNIEVKTAKMQGIPILSHGQALALMTKSKKAICVAGVGGKTSTSSMIATIFDLAKTSPSYAIGVGKINPLGLPAKFNKKGQYFIVEADEYFSPAPDLKPKFWYLNPFVTIITNLEYDHPDVYKNLNHTLKVFARFIERVSEKGLVLVCLDNPHMAELIQLTKVSVTTYGFSKKADWQITSFNQRKEKITFSLKQKTKEFKDIVLSVPGEFNVKNAAAAFITAHFCGIPLSKIKQGLKKFKGTKRRFEFIKEINGIKLYDDYAHHPIQIKAAIIAAKKWFENKKIIVVFQPHTYSRTKALLSEFSRSFSSADLVIITDIYASSREEKDSSVSGKLLTEKIKKFNKNVFYKKGEKEVSHFLKLKAEKGNIIFTMGAGDIFNWHSSIAKAIEGE